MMNKARWERIVRNERCTPIERIVLPDGEELLLAERTDSADPAKPGSQTTVTILWGCIELGLAQAVTWPAVSVPFRHQRIRHVKRRVLALLSMSPKRPKYWIGGNDGSA